MLRSGGNTTGFWNTAANWTPPTVPNESADTATFDLSNITDVTLSTSTTVDGMAFNPGASAFTITASPLHLLTFVGAGIPSLAQSATCPMAIMTINANNFQASYEGGDGNDLTLTVVSN